MTEKAGPNGGKIELLAPAGSFAALRAAVENGADAVYLGGKAFGARHYAANFDDKELAEAVEYAHVRGVAIHVTVNTLVDDGEIPALLAYLRYLYDIGVDAIIVQDLGVAEAARRVVPDLSLHASTQMTVHNLAGVQLLEEKGFSRVVLARELTLAEITNIAQHTSLEVEVFCHGALCICYSGQCLMSSMIGARSGNRGRCAQPCRLPYTLVNKAGQDVLAGKAGQFLLSPRDLNTIELLPHLQASGVTSLKIEGRMKRPEYVAVVVANYRQALDAVQAGETNQMVGQQQQELAQIFNRDFTTAYLQGRPGRLMMSDLRPNNRGIPAGRVVKYDAARRLATIKLTTPLRVGDGIEIWVKVGGRVGTTVSSLMVNGRTVSEAGAGVVAEVPVPAPVHTHDRVFKTSDSELLARARRTFQTPGAYRRIAVAMDVTVTPNQPLYLTVRDVDGHDVAVATAEMAQPAINRPLTAAWLRQQLDRLGDTVFMLHDFSARITDQVMVPVSAINAARRQAIRALTEARLADWRRPPLRDSAYEIGCAEVHRCLTPTAHRKVNRPLLSVHVDTVAKGVEALQAGADIIRCGGEVFGGPSWRPDDYEIMLRFVRQTGKKVIFTTPRIVRADQEQAAVAELRLFAALAPDGISVANLGMLRLARQYTSLPIFVDYPLNVFNSVAVYSLAQDHVAGVTLSPELTLAQIRRLAGHGLALECVVHGYLTLMVTEYCPLGSFIGQVNRGPCRRPCVNCGPLWLKDRKGALFPLRHDQFCRSHIFNADMLSMLPHVPELASLGLASVRIEAKIPLPGGLGRVVSLYRRLLDGAAVRPQDVAAVEQGGITRGHFFRGVLGE